MVKCYMQMKVEIEY